MENTLFPEEIQRACRLGDVSLLKKILTESPEFLNQVDNKLRWSPLYRTVICGHLEATEYLLSIGADPNIKNNLGETPLHQATDNSQAKLVKLLLRYKADPNIQQNGKSHTDGSTPLHQSAFKGDEKIVSILLSHGADCNLPNFVFGKTPLHYAVEYLHEEVVKLLIGSNANVNFKDKTGRSALEVAQGPIKTLLIRSPRSPNSTDRSFHNSPLLLPSPEPVDAIPSIPLLSFAVLNLSPLPSSPPISPPVKHSENCYSEKQSYSISTVFEPDAEKSQLDIRPSKAFSFGGCEGKALINWLESVKLEELYESLMGAGYDDADQMIAQMMSGIPITEESLIRIGIKKSGHRMRLLAALDEESRPFKSSRRTYRAQQNNPLKCCMVAIPSNLGWVAAPELEKWLGLMDLAYTFPLFVENGFDDLEQLLAMMNSRWEITENILANDIGINKQAHRYKILARLKVDSVGFESMKKGGVTSRHRKEEMSIEKNVNSTACNSCAVF